MVSKIFTTNATFLEDYSNENRIFVITEIPTELINCFLVSEDINFYNHIGVDAKGIFRAFAKNLKKFLVIKDQRGINNYPTSCKKLYFLQTNFHTARKIKEMILSFRMEKILLKNK